MAYSSGNNKDKLLSSKDLDRLTQEITKGLEKITTYIEELREFEEKLGTKYDTRNLRMNMRNKIDQAQNEVKSTLNSINDLQGLELNTKSEQEVRNKMAKRFKDAFNKEKNEFLKVIKQINEKEKIYIDLAKKSMVRGRADSFNENSGGNDDGYKQDEIHIQEIEYNEEDINERQKDIEKVKKVINLMNELSQQQIQEITEQGNQLEDVVGDIESTKQNVEKGRKKLETAATYERSSTKRNLCICMIILIAAASIVAIILFVINN